MPAGLAEYLPRWVVGTVWTYCSFEALVALLTACGKLFGMDLPLLHDNPILSRSLGEFWGRRWNLSVHRMLLEQCYRPVSRHLTPMAATTLTFAASAAIHFWITIAAGGLVMATSMALFFLVQAGLVLLERRISVRSWRRPLQHVWTVTSLLTTVPLLLEPLLRITFA